MDTGDDIEFQDLGLRHFFEMAAKESREDMMFQTQSRSYQEWMKEDEWDQALEALGPNSTLPLAKFNP